MMYNRYRGNGSKPERIPEPAPKKPQPPPVRQSPVLQKSPSRQKGGLMSVLPRKAAELETEDLLLILILYLMYRESGDKELLIILGAMLFL